MADSASLHLSNWKTITDAPARLNYSAYGDSPMVKFANKVRLFIFVYVTIKLRGMFIVLTGLNSRL